MSIAAVNQAISAEAQHVQSLLQMASGYWVSQCLYVVASLGIADLLAEGPKELDALAQATQADADYLYRILRALCSMGVFSEMDNKLFVQTPISRLLCADVPHSVRSAVVMMGAPEHYQAWGNLLDSVKTGSRPFETVFKMPVFEYFATHPEASEIFNQAMTVFATNMHRTVVSVYDFSRFHTLVDVGGGHGALITSILDRTAALKGVLFDLPHVVAGATVPSILQQRFEAVGGDFFKSVHPGGDAYILSTVIHDWSDELALKILRNIHTAMNEGGTLLLVENVIAADNQPHPGKFMDINMLVMTEGGRERTAEEFRALYEAAGFELSKIIATPSGLCIVEGKKR